MASMKWASSWVDAVAPIKSNIRALFRDEVASYQTLAELQANTLAATRLVLVGGVPFLLDAADVTSSDNGFNIVVSADGYRYKMVTGFREKLTANRNYYVNPSGSNSSDGLVAGRAFLTLQKAIDVVAALDMSIYSVTINVAAGTYTAGATVSAPFLGTGTVTILGSTGSTSSYIVSTAGICISVSNGARLSVSGLQLASSGSSCLHAANGGAITIAGNCNLGAAGGYHMYCDGGTITASANYSIVGAAFAHWYVSGGRISAYARTVTNTGTNAFSYFAWADMTGVIFCPLGTIGSGGTITGTRYLATGNGVINTGGGGASYLPGNAAGSTSTGGQYV